MSRSRSASFALVRDAEGFLVVPVASVDSCAVWESGAAGVDRDVPIVPQDAFALCAAERSR